MTLTDLNNLGAEKVTALLQTCCGASNWAKNVTNRLPFGDEKELIEAAEDVWYNRCGEIDWREAFGHHPRIGDTKSPHEKYSSSQHFATAEQATVRVAAENTITQLAQLNDLYEAKFGFIFIICATGKSADEMLRLITDRITNSNDEELLIAMGEQHKITLIRLQKLLDSPYLQKLPPSQLTTHVLDTSTGKPGQNITVRLKAFINGDWQAIAQAVTNSDGRVADLLPAGKKLAAAVYKIIFETERYFLDSNTKGFYPEVEIQFTISDDAHYHVPLLISPFGYSTYRGS